MHTLSKSQYIRGLQCSKSLWLYRNRKDLAPETTAEKQGVFNIGNLIGQLAMDRFPDGVEVTNEYWDIKGAIEATNSFIATGQNVIFEATAIHPITGGYSKIDILKRVNGTDQWDLIEVKSSAKVKSYHEDDLAFQYYVFNGSGYKIRKCFMMLVDNSYVRKGDIEPANILRLEDISKSVLSKQGEVKKVTNDLCDVLEKSGEVDVQIGAKCSQPFECEYKSFCWDHIPNYSIYNIFQKKKAEIIERQYGAALEGLPVELYPGGLKGIDLASYFDGKARVDSAKISTFLAGIQYPIYFFDYETIGPTIPIFDGTRPFQKIPFQFSLHVQKAPGQKPVHYEYLHKEQSDPRLALAAKLIELCGSEGTILVYNQSFEIARNNELAKEFPMYRDALQSINSRIVDLITPFKKRWLYHPSQNGSASLKDVLPTFTDLNYNDLEISDGGDAMRQYAAFMEGKLDKSLWNNLWEDLSKYCEQDTHALYALLGILEKIAGKDQTPEASLDLESH